ncbi:MAG: TolC family protein [Bacteroidaceae bacterium]|nr:TolC family protein [Bacteroidaceae bacterium]
MRKLTVTIILILSACMAVCAHEADLSSPMTLQECLVYARDHSSVNLQNRYSYEQQRIALQNSAMQFLPYISASANANISFGRGIDPETNTYGTKQTLGSSFGLSMSLPLFDGLVNVNNYKMNRSYVRTSQTTAQMEADEVSLAVIKAFYNVVYCKELVLQVQLSLEVARENLRQTRRQEQLGSKSRADVDEMSATVADNEYQLVNQQNLLDMARLDLKAAMSWPAERPIEIDGRLQEVGDEDAFSCDINLLELPRARIAGEKLHQRKLAVRIARGNFVPSISLSAGMSTSYYKTLNMNYEAAPFHRQFRDNIGKSISTGISIPIFGRLSKYNSLRTSKLNYKIEQSAYDETMRNLTTEMMKLVMNLQGARKEYLSSISRLTAVESAHAAIQRKYELGKISALELSTSSSRLAQARATLTGKHIQLLIQKIQYDYYNGKPYIKE